MPLVPGKHLGPYEIVSIAGEGGMGHVFRALDKRLNRYVAIKVLPVAQAHDDSPRQRLLQEAQAASSLNHPNIVTIFEVGSQDGIDFIVMEFVNGVTLKRKIGRKSMRLAEGLHYAIQVADALAAA